MVAALSTLIFSFLSTPVESPVEASETIFATMRHSRSLLVVNSKRFADLRATFAPRGYDVFEKDGRALVLDKFYYESNRDVMGARLLDWFRAKGFDGTTLRDLPKPLGDTIVDLIVYMQPGMSREAAENLSLRVGGGVEVDIERPPGFRSTRDTTAFVDSDMWKDLDARSELPQPPSLATSESKAIGESYGQRSLTLFTRERTSASFTANLWDDFRPLVLKREEEYALIARRQKNVYSTAVLKYLSQASGCQTRQPTAYSSLSASQKALIAKVLSRSPSDLADSKITFKDCSVYMRLEVSPHHELDLSINLLGD